MSTTDSGAAAKTLRVALPRRLVGRQSRNPTVRGPDLVGQSNETHADCAEPAVIRLMLGVEDALRAIRPAAPERGAAVPEVQGLLDAIADIFNIANKMNVAAVSPLFSNAGQPTAAYDPRQFQFAMKLNW